MSQKILTTLLLTLTSSKFMHFKTEISILCSVFFDITCAVELVAMAAQYPNKG